MLSGKLVIMPVTYPWKWSTDYHEQTARILSKKNLVICLVPHDAVSLKDILLRKKPLSILEKQAKNIYFYQKIYLLPFRRFDLIEHLNEKLQKVVLKLCITYLEKRNHFQRVLWIFEPGFSYVADELATNNSLTIYDCVDFYAGTDVRGTIDNKIAHLERSLLQSSDFAFVNSHTLCRLHQKHRPDLHVVPQGFREEIFQRYQDKRFLKIRNKKPIVGYIGGINTRIDYQMLYTLAKRIPMVEFVLIGPVQLSDDISVEVVDSGVEKLLRLSNVSFYPALEKKEIPGVIKQFDIFMIPYHLRSDFNRYCYPMKLFEYFYVGKPVIAPPIEELKLFPKFVTIAHSVAEWEKAITDLLSKPWPSSYKREQKKLSVANSWHKKIQAISEVIQSKSN